MTQYNTFFIPITDGGEAQSVLNAFLRSHRVLQVEKTVFASGWGFCVEWLDGTPPSAFAARERVDYIRKYFDSISHNGLRRMLYRKFKDERIIYWFDKIIGTHETEPGRGLPIGNLTSQHLANLYLDSLDRFFRVSYVRYMDDFVSWSNDRNVLKVILRELPEFLNGMGLTLKENSYINRTAQGMDFLGMRVWPWTVGANRASLKRYSRKVAVQADFQFPRERDEYEGDPEQVGVPKVKGRRLCLSRRRTSASNHGCKTARRNKDYI